MKNEMAADARKRMVLCVVAKKWSCLEPEQLKGGKSRAREHGVEDIYRVSGCCGSWSMIQQLRNSERCDNSMSPMCLKSAVFSMLMIEVGASVLSICCTRNLAPSSHSLPQLGNWLLPHIPPTAA